jgi:hypothetical protein
MNDTHSGSDCKYSIVSESEKRYGLSVNSAKFQTVNPNSPYTLPGHPDTYSFGVAKGRIINEYQFLYITEGTGELAINSTEVLQVSEGQIIVLFPGQWHTCQPTFETGWKEYSIGFCGEMIEEVIRNSFLSNKNQIVDIGLNDELIHLFKRAISLVEMDKNTSQQHLFGIVMHMVGLIHYQSQQ